MDNDSLQELLSETSERQFWLKPWGSRNYPDHPNALPGTQFFAKPELEIAFSKLRNRQACI
jgi:hypothetical protein